MKKPSQFRCLIGLAASLPMFFLAGVQAMVDTVVARHPALTVTVIPETIAYSVMAIAIAGAAYSVYRVVRDFYFGDFYLDLSHYEDRLDGRWRRVRFE